MEGRKKRRGKREKEGGDRERGMRGKGKRECVVMVEEREPWLQTIPVVC